MEEMIALNGYFKEHFKANEIPKSELSKAHYLLMKNQEAANHHSEVNIEILKWMPNLKTATIQLHNISNWSNLLSLTSL